MKRSRYFIIAIVILALLWIQAELRSYRLTAEITRIHSTDVVLEAVDATTRQPLHIAIHGPGTAAGQQWPKQFGVTATGDLSKMDVHWIGVGSVTVGVSAEGYEQSDLQIDQPSDSTIIVPLRRSGRP
jgi:hypothetical protein